MPGLAFTRDGLRLGHGRGYYDRFLNDLSDRTKSTGKERPYTIGLAFEEQIVAQIPVGNLDFVLDEVLTSTL